ncbi:MAG: ABC transporter substrate-binding protein [Oscillospiraceae bacterium]|nr:ABC transporter substrate-binding protein [Oscillospiraceae bacterium]
MNKKLLLTITAACMLLTACGQGASQTASQTSAADTAAESAADTSAETAAETAAPVADSTAKPDTDRAGNPITIPDEVDRIISLNPATTQTLLDFGLADKIVAVDEYSMSYADRLAADIPVYSMYEPDQESMVALEPDIVFTSGMVYAGGDNPYINVVNAGVCVADIPSSASIAAIEDDIRFIGACVGEEEKAEQAADDMQARFDELKAIGDTIPAEEKKSVMFWLSVPDDSYPTIYTVGSGTFIDEMINAIGATNAAGTEEGWPAFSEEAAIAADPDIILHSVSYVPDVAGSISSRAGWENTKAVKNGAIYYVDENTSNRPNAHVIEAMEEMAKLIYPDKY